MYSRFISLENKPLNVSYSKLVNQRRGLLCEMIGFYSVFDDQLSLFFG